MPLPPGAHQVKGQRNLIRLADGRIVTRSTALSMSARAEGYSSEYERRKARRTTDTDTFWKQRAIRAINEIDWTFLYIDDGSPGRERLSDTRYDDITPDHNAITPERVLALGERIGYQQLTKMVREKKYIQDLYWEADFDDATNRYLDIWRHDTHKLPDWFWWYHGFSATPA